MLGDNYQATYERHHWGTPVYLDNGWACFQYNQEGLGSGLARKLDSLERWVRMGPLGDPVSVPGSGDCAILDSKIGEDPSALEIRLHKTLAYSTVVLMNTKEFFEEEPTK